MRRRHALFTVAAVLLVTAGCTPAEPGPEPTSTTTSTTPVTSAIPDTAVGRHVSRVAEAIGTGEAATAEEVEGWLAPSVLAQVTPEQIVAVLDQLRAQGPWVAGDYQGTATEAVVLLRAEGADPLDLSVTVDADGLMTGISFTASAADRVAATSWQRLGAAVEALPADVTLVVTQIRGEVGAGEVFTAGTPDEAQPLGSVFKLYVLGAVVRAVADGTLTWDDELVVTDEVRSLPSGELQDSPTGTTVTVREAAEAMIAISDNTAADLLAATVGRDAVEQAVVDLARTAAATLARGYLGAGDRVGLDDLGVRRRPLPPGAGARQLDRIRHGLALSTPVGEPQRRVRAPRVPSGALVVLFSTFLDDEAAQVAASWRAAGHRVLAVDVLPHLQLAGLTRTEAMAVRLVRIPREDRLAALADRGVSVLRWVDEPGVALRLLARGERCRAGAAGARR